MKRISSLLILVLLLCSVCTTVSAGDLKNPDLLTSNVTIVSGETGYYTTNGEVDCSIKVEDGATLVLVDAQIKCTTDNPIQFLGNGTLLLVGESSIISNCNNCAAINVVAGGQLTIEDYASDGDIGSLTAIGGYRAAGIGGNYFEDVGEIVINSGTINATGGYGSAAIGGGNTYNSEEFIFTNPSIIINDGSITANGNSGGAGIGSGKGQCYTLMIEINGGEITSTGGEDGPGIGGGYLVRGSGHTTININGGNIDAVGKADGAGIGNSFTSNYTYDLIINIAGGDINARCMRTGNDGFGGNDLGAGIGSGPIYSSSGWGKSNPGDQIINISGGKIYALAGLNGFNKGGAGIGGGHLSAIDSVNITGGLVYARGYRYTSNDIGGGYRAQGFGTREISGDSIVFVYDENDYFYNMNSIQAPNHTRYSRNSFEDILAQNNIYGIDSYFFSCRYIFIPNTVTESTPKNNVSGTIYDYYGNVLDGITVKLDTHLATSGVDGSFSINNIDMTDYTLNIEDGAALLNQYEYKYASSASNSLNIDDTNNIITAKIFDNYDVNLLIQLNQDGTVAKVVPEVEYQIIYHDSLNATNTNPTSYVETDGAISIADISKTGYTFDGWYNNSSYSGDAITSIAEEPTGKIDLYAKWTANTYVLTFHMNDGISSDVNTQNILYGQTEQLNENTFEYKGYTFSHWNTESNGSGDSYEDLAAYTMYEEGDDLYAIWSVNTDTGYSIQYYLQNVDDDDYTVYETVIKYGTTDTLASIVSDDIKKFVGFNYVMGHENEKLSGNINGDESLVLQLYYDRVINDIIFNANTMDTSLSGVPANIENVRYGERITIPNNPLRDGYSLAAWTDGITTFETGNSFVMPANTVTLLANWEANTYKVLFNSNGGIGEMTNQEFTYGVSQNLCTNTFERERYTFGGWATSADGEVVYTDGQDGCYLIADGSEELILYAVWNEIPVNSIRFVNTSVLINNNTTYLLLDICPLAISPSDATNQNVTWESSDASVVSIDSRVGTITANGQGTAVITVTAADTSGGSAHSATCIVTVKQAVTGMDISQKTATLALDGTETIDLDETISPSDATDQKVTWASSDTSVAMVDTDGVVTAVAKGTATITVTATDTSSGSVQWATCIVTVKQAVTGVSLSQKTATLALDGTETIDLDETISPSDATDKTVTWASSDTSVAMVDTDGVVTAVAKGTATITVTATDTSSGSVQWATCIVTVKQAVTGVSLSQKTATLALDGTETIDLDETISPSDATDKTVTWASSDTSVAMVDSNGVVTAVAKGTATITVTATDTSGGSAQSATCAVTVSELVPTTTPISTLRSASVGAVIVEEDPDTAEIVIEINPVDLPSGTVLIQLSSGETIALNGTDTIQFIVGEDDLSNGAISIIALNDEGVPIAALDIQIYGGKTNTIPDTGNAWDGLWRMMLWVLIGIVGVSVIASVVFIILKRKR